MAHPPVRTCFFVILLLASCAASERLRKVFVHYLPWFDAEGLRYPERTGWCYPAGGTYDCQNDSTIHYSNTPLIGEYSLFDTHVLEYHLLLIQVAGIDGIIININPASAMQRSASLALLDKIAAMNALYNPHFEMKAIVSYDDGSAASEAAIPGLIEWTVQNVYMNGKYAPFIFHDDQTSSPVYLVWSESNRALYWSELNAKFGGNVTVLMRNAVGFEYSTGNFEWVNYLNRAPPKSDASNWGQQYFNDMDWIMAHQLDFGVSVDTINHLKMGGVYPGFDDVNVPPFWNGGQNRYILRTVNAGSTMNLTWQKQIGYVPQRLGGSVVVANPWVQVVTWNDWPEGTSIEPASLATYGYAAITVCHQQIPRFKQSANRYNTACLFEPHRIYQLRKNGLDSSADQAVLNLLQNACQS